MLAQRLTGILPPLTIDGVLEVSTIWRVAGLLPAHGGLVAVRPFRAPHHMISVSGLIGAAAPPHPGEVTLAHLGVLFLDGLPEFAQHVLESPRRATGGRPSHDRSRPHDRRVPRALSLIATALSSGLSLPRSGRLHPG